METVTIAGKEVPISELVSAYTKLPTISSEAQALREAQTATRAELEDASRAREAIRRIQDDPQFARQFADNLKAHHADSAFFREDEVTPPVAELQDDIDIEIPTGGLPHMASASENTVFAQQIEALQTKLARQDAERNLEAVRAKITGDYPSLDFDAMLEDAVKQSVPLELLHLVADSHEAKRLSGELSKRETNNSMLSELMGMSGGTDTADSLARLGSSLSASQLSADADVDYTTLSTEDALMLAMKQVDAGELHG